MFGAIREEDFKQKGMTEEDKFAEYLADRIVRDLQRYGLTPDEMLRVLELAREKLLKRRKILRC